MTDLYSLSEPMDASRTLALYQQFYEAHGPALPAGRAEDMKFVEHLRENLSGLEGLILDSYGVIGLGSAPIKGITDLFDAAHDLDIPIVILTNGASKPAISRVAGYREWGLDIDASQIVSSRDACYQKVKQIQADNPSARFSYLGKYLQPFDDVAGPVYGTNGCREDGWDKADYFIFLGAIGWQEEDQKELETALATSGGKLIVGNPDVSAPQVEGFSLEPGFWAMKAADETGCEMIMTGKPFGAAYDIALEALARLSDKPIQPEKVGMVGDSLHTDILGAKSCGLQAILLSSYGLLAGRDILDETNKAQIYPDIIARYL